MKREAKQVIILLMLMAMLLTLTACSETGAPSGDRSSPSSAPSASLTTEPTPTPVSRAAMNDVKTIVEGMEALLEPSYANRTDPDRLEIPADFAPGPNEVFSNDVFDWDLGSLTIWMDENGAVNHAMVSTNDHTIVNNIAMALFASSIQGTTPKDGQNIADALHIGDMFFPENYDKYIYVLDHEGYYYIYEIANNLILSVLPNDTEPNYAASVFFDIGGNELKNPAAGTDGYDAEGNYSTSTGDAAKDALVQSLLPPESTIEQAASDSVDVNSLTDYADTLQWYEENLPVLGFTGLIPEEEQALLDMDEASKIYSGTIGSQPVTIMVRDWSGTQSGDMSLITILFTAYGG